MNIIWPSGGDDTARIQARIDDATRDHLFLSQGTFLISGAGLSITKTGFQMRGAGFRNTILQHSGAGNALTLGTGELPTILDVALSDFKVLSDGAGAHGIEVASRSVQNLMRNVWASGFTSGTGIRFSNIGFSARLEGCRADSCQDGYYFGTQSQNAVLVGCRALTNTRYGFHAFDNNSISLLGCQIEKNYTAGILAQGVTGLTIQGLYNEQNVTYPGPSIILEAGDVFGLCRAVDISGGRCLGNNEAADCIVCHAVNGLKVSGLRIQTFTTTSIKDDPVAPGTVTNIWDGGGNNFDVEFVFDQPALIA